MPIAFSVVLSSLINYTNYYFVRVPHTSPLASTVLHIHSNKSDHRKKPKNETHKKM